MLQAVLMLHKTRDLLVRQRTGLINALRAHLAEYGIISSKGPGSVTALMIVLHEAQERLPFHARSALHVIGAQFRALAGAIERLEAQILAWRRADDASRRLATIPGIGPITASAIAAVPDATMFRSGRQFAAWRRKPKSKVLVHSDQGSQFTSMDWAAFLKHHNLEHSPLSDTSYRLPGNG